MEVGVVQRVTAEKPNLLALRDMVERRIGAFQDTHYPCNPPGGSVRVRFWSSEPGG